VASVVFLRGINVGGHRPLRPAALAKDLSAFDVVNVGAAGTFVFRKKASQAAVRSALLRRIPFEVEFMICPGKDLADLVSADPFAREASREGARRFLSVLGKRPRRPPPLPLLQPAGRAWQVKVVALRGRFAVSLWRRVGKRLIYPNEVVEKELAVPATTRGWETLLKIRDRLDESKGMDPR